MSSPPLENYLTPLDKAVWAAFDGRTAVRYSDVFETVRKAMARQQAPTSTEVRAVLRGFEHLGALESRHGGWWRRVG